MADDHKQILITLTGDLGSGKSSLARRLCSALDAEYYSTGRVQRQLAHELGLSVLEMNRRADKDPSIDKKIDSIFESLAESEDNLVVDSRMAWHFLPRSLKVRLCVDEKVGAERIIQDEKRQREGYTNLDEAIELIRARKQSERERFLRTYNVDITDEANYNLSIDTTNLTSAEVFDRVIAAVKKL